MLGSSSQYSSRSFEETSALLPIETNDERPRPRAAACSSSASPSAPLCEENPMLPGREVCGAKVAFSPGPATKMPEAVRADQPGAVRAHPREQLLLAAHALDAGLGEAGRDHAERPRAPFASAASASARTASPGTQKTARSTTSGMSAIDG